MQVRATAKGYYGSKVREPGEAFAIAKEEDFSEAWMVKVEPEKAEKPAKAVKVGPAAE